MSSHAHDAGTVIHCHHIRMPHDWSLDARRQVLGLHGLLQLAVPELRMGERLALATAVVAAVSTDVRQIPNVKAHAVAVGLD